MSHRHDGFEFRRGGRYLLAATLGVSLGISSLPFYSAGVFVTALETAFDWTRQQIALAAMAGTVTAAIAAPFVGTWIDRAGVRGPASFGLAALGLGLAGYALLPGDIRAFIIWQILVTAAAASSSPLSFTRVVNDWFERGRGLALGITLAGMGVTATLAPLLATAALEAGGWRFGYVVLGAAALVTAPVVWMLMAGGEPGPVSPPAVARDSSPGFRTALASPLFWRLAAIFGAIALAVAGFVLHMIPLLRDAGLSAGEAAAIQSALGASVIAGRLTIGFLIDRFAAPFVAAGALALCAAGIATLGFGGADYALIAAIAVGFALGAEVDLIGYFTARYFDLSAYGRVYGLLYGLFVLAAGISPLLIAYLATGPSGYTPAIATGAGLCLAAAAACATLPNTRKTPA